MVTVHNKYPTGLDTIDLESWNLGERGRPFSAAEWETKDGRDHRGPHCDFDEESTEEKRRIATLGQLIELPRPHSLSRSRVDHEFLTGRCLPPVFSPDSASLNPLTGYAYREEWLEEASRCHCGFWQQPFSLFVNQNVDKKREWKTEKTQNTKKEWREGESERRGPTVFSSKRCT